MQYALPEIEALSIDLEHLQRKRDRMVAALRDFGYEVQVPESTFYLHHNAVKGFHIDFIFASPSLLSQASRVDVGTHADWAKLSDHMPVVCSFARKRY